jgi:GTP pyrophosphokinase
MEESDNSTYTDILFTVQVHDRVHLADLMRRLRKIPDVVRMSRAKGTGTEQRAQ